MSYRPVVFLGPSLALSAASQILDADFRPPLRAGDLDKLPERGIVGIVDGVLEPSLHISSAEVRRAGARDLRLFGAASTGALLAVAFPPPTLTGLGRVQEVLTFDPETNEDLVAVLYSDPDGKRLTEPLINALLTLIDLVGPDDASPTAVAGVVGSLRRLPLPERSTPAVLASLQIAAHDAGFPRVPTQIRDYKGADAMLLLRHLASVKPSPQHHSGPDSDLPRNRTS